MEEKPLLLVDIDQSGKCTLNPEALSFLRNITENICVASVAGMYRTGKSYLLNRLMGKQHGFEIGPTVNACTKGIWIWGSPIILSNKTLILIDTEGLGSINRDQTIDMIIFSLSVLISSTFIYNSMGVIDEQALEDLSLVCKLTQHIHVKSHQGTASADTYAQYFPKFIWVLRDFSLQLVDDDGNSISSNTYLSNCLVPVEDSGEESKQKNTIRKILREFFRDKECVTFVRPVHQEKKLRNIQEVPFEELRKEFKEQINSFVENVYDTTTIKKIDGVPVNGTLLATLLEVYVDAINRDAVPTISTAWERTIDAQIKEAYKKASEIYKISIKKVKSQIPIEEIQLKSLESDSRKQGLKVIDSVPVIPALREEIEKIKHKYFEKCDQTLESILLENFSLSKSKSSNFLKDAFEVMEEKILNSEKLHWVPEEFSQLYDVNFI